MEKMVGGGTSWSSAMSSFYLSRLNATRNSYESSHRSHLPPIMKGHQMTEDQNKSSILARKGVVGPPTSQSGVDTFLTELKGLSTPGKAMRGRLIFALDATASRQPTWDTACTLQGEMFCEIGGLDLQLVYYR